MVPEGDFFGDTPADPSMDLTMDDLFMVQAVKHDEVRQTEADSLRPVGTYTTTRLTMVHDVEGPVDYHGNPNPRKGRSVFRFYGAAVLTADEKTAPALKVAVGTELKGFFTFRISPDRFNWDDGSPDTQTKLWAMAVKAYSAAFQQKPSTVRQVVEYLRDYPIRLRVIQKNTKEDAKGEPRNDVVAISAVREVDM